MRAEKKMTAEQEILSKAAAIGIPPEQLERGQFEIADVRLDDGERVTTHRTMINRGGTAIERWLHAGAFSQPETDAIRFCQALWAKIDLKGKGANEISVRGHYLWLGQSEHEARAELAKLQGKDQYRIPTGYWSVFEDVCRFHSSAADAGATMASNNRSAVDAARLCTAFVAATVATRLGL